MKEWIELFEQVGRDIEAGRLECEIRDKGAAPAVDVVDRRRTGTIGVVRFEEPAACGNVAASILGLENVGPKFGRSRGCGKDAAHADDGNAARFPHAASSSLLGSQRSSTI